MIKLKPTLKIMQLITTTPIIDLGNVKSGTSVNFTFNITNNGIQPITVGVRASCGCTKPILERTKMGPLECQEGKGTFKASKNLGRIQNKTVTVTDNQGSNLIIKLTGTVI